MGWPSRNFSPRGSFVFFSIFFCYDVKKSHLKEKANFFHETAVRRGESQLENDYFDDFSDFWP
jgi:hypothetical protein